MLLKLIIDGQTHPLQVPDNLITEAAPLFDKMDKDMDQGWQMSRSWVAELSRVNRLQVAANKLLTAMETDNENLKMMMAAYILNRAPNVDYVDVDTQGEMLETEIGFKQEGGVSPFPG